MWTLTSFMAGRFLQGTTTGRAGRPCGGRYRRDIGLATVRFPEGASGYVASTTNVPTGGAQFCDVPPAGFEPALPPPEGGALSPELRGPQRPQKPYQHRADTQGDPLRRQRRRVQLVQLVPEVGHLVLLVVAHRGGQVRDLAIVGDRDDLRGHVDAAQVVPEPQLA